MFDFLFVSKRSPRTVIVVFALILYARSLVWQLDEARIAGIELKPSLYALV